jgi:plastocyanin
MGRAVGTKVGIIALGVALPAALIGCGSTATTTASTSAPSTAESTTTTAAGLANAGASVVITEFAFTAPNITIKANQAVTWKNEGSAKHTVTAEKDQDIDFKSPTLAPGDAPFVQTFTTPGKTYKYFCSIHGKDKMSGTITVTPA